MGWGKLMVVGERQTQKQQRGKTPSFSASLLDTIYQSIDEPRKQHQLEEDTFHLRRYNSAPVEQEIESLRRAIMVEKWMENDSNQSSCSASSTDSSWFSPSETDSSASRSSVLRKHTGAPPSTAVPGEKFPPPPPAKSRAASKIHGDSKKAKGRTSPGVKIANFWNSIFGSRNLKKIQLLEEWNSRVRESRSVKDTSSSMASRSWLIKNSSSSTTDKSRSSVRFRPAVSVVVEGEDSQRGSQFIKKNVDGSRLCEGKNLRRHELGDLFENGSDFDEKSCASSDLFELENIGRISIGAYEQESFKMNQGVDSGLMMQRSNSHF